MIEREGKDWRVEKPGSYGGPSRFNLSHVIARHRRLRPAIPRKWHFQFEMRRPGIFTILGESYVLRQLRPARDEYDQESWFTVPQVPLTELQRQLQRGPVLVLDSRIAMSGGLMRETSEMTTIRMSKAQHAALAIWLDETLEQGNLRGLGMLGGLLNGSHASRLSGINDATGLPATMWSDGGKREGGHWVMEPTKGVARFTLGPSGSISLFFDGQLLKEYESYSELAQYIDKGGQYHTSDPGHFWGSTPSVQFHDTSAVMMWFDSLLESGQLAGLGAIDFMPRPPPRGDSYIMRRAQFTGTVFTISGPATATHKRTVKKQKKASSHTLTLINGTWSLLWKKFYVVAHDNRVGEEVEVGWYDLAAMQKLATTGKLKVNVQTGMILTIDRSDAAQLGVQLDTWLTSGALQES